MTIHTFEASSPLSNKDYYDIQNIMENHSNNWTFEDNNFSFWGLCDSGINIKLNKINKKNYNGYAINYIISARRVIENNNYVGLFNCKDYDKLIKRINKILSNLSELLPKIDKCTVSRYDFCVNIEMENQEQVKTYLKILKRGNIPNGYKLHTYYDMKSKRTKPSKDDFTITSRDNVEISIYNKYKQMKKEKKEYPDIMDAKNILRIEIRCFNDKLKYYKKKYDIKNISELMKYSDKIGRYLYKYYLGKMFGTGDFYTLDEASKRIEANEFKSDNKEIMTELVKDVSELRSLEKALHSIHIPHSKRNSEDLPKINKKYIRDTYKKILYMFDLIDTSPITFPREDKKIFGGKKVLNPLNLFYEYLENL